MGILTGVLAHPVAWYLGIVWSYASGARSSLGERTVNPLQGLAACLIYGCLSVLLTGWLTVPAGLMHYAVTRAGCAAVTFGFAPISSRICATLTHPLAPAAINAVGWFRFAAITFV